VRGKGGRWLNTRGCNGPRGKWDRGKGRVLHHSEEGKLPGKMDSARAARSKEWRDLRLKKRKNEIYLLQDRNDFNKQGGTTHLTKKKENGQMVDGILSILSMGACKAKPNRGEPDPLQP